MEKELDLTSQVMKAAVSRARIQVSASISLQDYQAMKSAGLTAGECIRRELERVSSRNEAN